jgi:DNA-binding transcriptional LysR family regulator
MIAVAELNLDDLAVFVRVVERGGFARAARELGTPTSTVSRAIERLESSSGVRLLHRTTRDMQPTSEGRDLYATAAPAVATLRAAALSIEPVTRKPKGRLRVTAPNDLGAGFLADVIVAFMDRHPLVQLDFSLTNRHQNLIEGGFDLALRATVRLDDSSLVARKLGQLELGLYAAPKYLLRRGSPTSPADLENHSCVMFRADELARTWALRDAEDDASVHVRGKIGGDDISFVRALVGAGAGIGLLPRINCDTDESNGRLVRVLPELHARGATLYVVYPSKKNVPARVTAFCDFVVDAFDTWARSH